MMLDGRRILITGGTGSLGGALVTRLLGGSHGRPERITVFSRDEAKQHQMRIDLSDPVLDFHIGDVRDYESVASAIRDANVVFNAAALKQVPSCEYHPFEAVRTNVGGAENIVRAVEQLSPPVEVVVGISTDKACEPVNVMGMTKAIQERVFAQANLRCGARFVCVRYGNVMGSRGSVIPVFREQIRRGNPVTITDPHMTRFMLSLDGAVDAVLAAARIGHAGEVLVPDAPSSRVVDIADAMIGERAVEVITSGVRPGEKIHEILVSDDEARRSAAMGEWFVIQSSLPELGRRSRGSPALQGEFSSADAPMNQEGTRSLMKAHGLL